MEVFGLCLGGNVFGWTADRDTSFAVLDAYTAAGSVITDDVPPGALGIARERQRNVEGYAERVSRRER